MDTYYIVKVLLALVAIGGCCSQKLEYLCNNNPADSVVFDEAFQVTFLLNLNYGERCSISNPRWSNLTNEVQSWSALVRDLSLNIVVIDTCGNSDVAMKAVSESIPYSWTIDGLDNRRNNVCEVVDTTRNSINIGYISEVQPPVSSLLSQSKVPFIVTADGFVRHEDDVTSSITTTGHYLHETIKMMLLFMRSLQWDLVTVVYSDDFTGRQSLELFQNISREYYMCIADAIAVDGTSALTSSINSSGLVYLGSEGIGLQLFPLVSFVSNTVWVTALDLKDLTLIGSHNIYSVNRAAGDATVDAIIPLSQALRRARSESTCTRDNPATCANTKEFRRSLNEAFDSLSRQNMSYTTDGDGSTEAHPRPADIIYNAYKYTNGGQRIHVASVSLRNGVTTNSNFSPQPSLCDPDKFNCESQCSELNTDDYIYIHAKWTILVSMPIHSQGVAGDIWSCKNFTDSTLYRTEAATYTFNYLRRELDEKDIGMLVIDSCGDKLKTASSIYDILRGRRRICDKNNQCFDPKSVVFFIGDYSSAVTRQIQTIMKELSIIQMSYGASSIILSDRDEFPYFLRTNPPDDLQAHFMVELLETLRSKSAETKINAVNILYTNGLYGRTGAQKVKEFLKQADICVNLERIFNETTAENNYPALIEDILDNAGDVKIIVAFIDPTHLDGFMEELSTSQLYSAQWKKEGLTFILSDTWNDDQERLRKYGDLIRGSFSFKFNSDFYSEDIETSLSSVDRFSISTVNPWLFTLIEETGNCKIAGNFLSSYSEQCLATTDLSHLVNESYALHLMKAITASVYGIRSLVIDTTHDILTDPNQIEERYKRMLNIKIGKTLEDKTRSEMPFTPEGNGRVGYTIYHIKLNEASGLYEPIYIPVQTTGFGNTDKLSDFKTTPTFYKGDDVSQDIQSVMEKCKPDSTTTEANPSAGDPESNSGLTAAVIALAVVFVLVVAAVVAFYFWKKKCSKRRNANSAHDGDRCQSGAEIYDQIPYTQYMSAAQRDSILKFVAENPGSAPPSYMLAADYDNSQAIYNVPRSNPPAITAPNSEVGVYNAAFSHGSASGSGGQMRLNVPGGSVASGASNSGSTCSPKSGSMTEVPSPMRDLPLVPTPAPRTSNASTPVDGTLGSNKSDYTTMTTVPHSELVEHNV